MEEGGAGASSHSCERSWSSFSSSERDGRGKPGRSSCPLRSGCPADLSGQSLSLWPKMGRLKALTVPGCGNHHHLRPGDPRTVTEGTQLCSVFDSASWPLSMSSVRLHGHQLCLVKAVSLGVPVSTCWGLSSFVCKLGARQEAWELTL